jgi:carboxypeptidase C (cathepsin A)
LHYNEILRSLFAVAVAVSLSANPGVAQVANSSAPDKSRITTTGVLSLLPRDSVTEHVLDTGTERLPYTATAGTLPLFHANGERAAAVFYTAYVLKDGSPRRPVTFVFNGGPGAASAFLHLGLAGPKVVDFGPDWDGARAELRDNPASWLRFTDLVMIDPVGTGWSRAADPDRTREFWSVQADAQALAKIISLYIARNGRTASPKYLMGASYGSFRAAKVARALQREQGLVVDGLVMVAPFLEGALQLGGSRFALGAALHLPSLAAATLDRYKRFTDDALAAAERFALTDYLLTLASGPPDPKAGHDFYTRIAEITGLPLDVVVRTRGYVRDAYVKHVRESRSEVVSAYDAALAAPDPYPESAAAEGPDPILDGFAQSLGGLFVAYAREQLGFATDMTFNLLNREVSSRWDWGRGGRNGASVARDLRELLALNSGLRVLVAHGRSDIVTPYAVSRYVLGHLPPLSGKDRTALKLYEGGHMFYFGADARAAFTADAKAFYDRSGS